jgi:hypothetical protein
LDWKLDGISGGLNTVQSIKRVIGVEAFVIRDAIALFTPCTVFRQLAATTAKCLKLRSPHFHTFGPDGGDKDQNKAESQVESNVGCFERWSETSDVIL